MLPLSDPVPWLTLLGCQGELCSRVLYTLFDCNEMVAVPIEVLISVCWFPVYLGVDGVVWS